MTLLLVGFAFTVCGVARLFQDTKGSGRGMTTCIVLVIGGYFLGVGLNT